MNTIVLVLATDSACLFLGFLFGRLTRATVEIEERMNDESEPPAPSSATKRKYRLTGTQLLALGVVVIGLVTALVGFNISRNQDRLAGCVVGYSNALADALDRRSASSADAFAALDTVMEKVVQAFSSPPSDELNQAVRQSIIDYVNARHRAKEAQTNNPLPDAPRDACKELLG